MNHRLLLGAVSAVTLTAAVTAMPVKAQEGSSQSVFNVLTNDTRFSTTIRMVYVAGAAQRLQEAGNLTVFAATDDGWDGSPYQGMLSSLSSTGATSEFPQSMAILQVIRGFFVRGEPTKAPAEDVRMQSNAGRPIELDKSSQTVKWVDPDGDAHSAHLSGQPIQASNGVIYPVDAVVGS